MGVNDTTVLKAIRFQNSLHHLIVFMSIYPYIGNLLEAPIETSLPYSFDLPISSQTMNGSVRQFI